MLAGMISSLLLPGPRSSPGPSRPWRIGTRPGPGRCPGRAQKYRPRARSPCDGGCPEERREQSWLSTPSQRREAFDSAPGGKIGASVGRGLGHPGAPPRPPALSMGPAPPCSIRRIPAALRPRRSALGPPERPRRAAPRRAPPVGALTCAAAATLRAPGSALRKLRPGPLPQPRAGGAGPAPAPPQSGAAVRRSWPIRAVPPFPGWVRRKHSRGIPPPRPALPDHPPAPQRSGPSHPA